MTILRALLSVSDKTGIVALAEFLAAQNIEILSTGGTAKLLSEKGITVTEVSDHTGAPEMLDGRVKTLHPKIHGGILGIRGNAEHKAAMGAHDISNIDLVVVNLYPFEQTVAAGKGFDACIENIDIGGPAMIRSAAKNHADVTIVTDPADYDALIEAMKNGGNATSPEQRKAYAAKAFARTASYDAAINHWFAKDAGKTFPDTLTLSLQQDAALRYGENPHQQGVFYAYPGDTPSLANAQQIQGAELSYNNMNDASAAYELVAEFKAPAVAIIKHANPCGVAIGATIEEAFAKALACDPVSAYGGIIATNRPLTKAFTDALGKLFLEVMIAPGADAAAKEALVKKKKLKLLISDIDASDQTGLTYKSISGGVLCQEQDAIVLQGELKTVTKQQPSDVQLTDLEFAFTVAKHVKSNTIVIARGGTTLGIGAGQMSRIDATRIACQKAADAKLDIKGAVLASDAFFPFADNVEIAAEAGITALIQPGGSIRDDEVIAMADTHNMAMVLTGIRHFKH